jgi:trehalose 6-phosphate synthase/phosphatase
MNLVAKEYLASRPDDSGVLVLSETAGAAAELGEALIVNANDLDGMAAALNGALTMPLAEQVQRNRPMRARLRRYDVRRWAADFLARLEDAHAGQQQQQRRRLAGAWIDQMRAEYRAAQRRLLLLDYDGTLVPLVATPTLAAPDGEVLALLRRLSAPSANRVVVISGRGNETLERWLITTGAVLVAEHGAWVLDDAASGWRRLASNHVAEWKDRLRPVLETFVDRTPGALLEEKALGMAWHYRNADPELGSQRAKELGDTLAGLLANTSLQVLRGSKVLEVKESNVGKGQTALAWLNATPPPDFVLAIGDDETDELLFEAMPETGWSVRVGHNPRSRARFYVDGTSAVRELLGSLAESDARGSERAP